MKIAEVFDIHQDFDKPDTDYSRLREYILSNSKFVDKVTKNTSLCEVGSLEWSLHLDDQVVAYLVLTEEMINHVVYPRLKMILTFPPHRGKGYAKTLLYAVKEQVGKIVIDGVVFNQGQQLIRSLASQPLSNIKVLDKRSGTVSKFVKSVNDQDFCYILESTGLKYGTQLLVAHEYTYYNPYGIE